MDFASLERDLEELQADKKVRDALFSGVDLTSYASEVQQELLHLVRNTIPEYVAEAPETRSLNREIEECDAVLGSIEQILFEFQRDLGGISEEIRFLQEESLSLGVKIKNRQDVDQRYQYFLERITIPEDLISHVLTHDVNVDYCNQVLKVLDEHMSFANDREGNFASLPLPICQTRSSLDVIPELDKLSLKATARLKLFFLPKIAQFKKPNTNIQILQQDLVKYKQGFLFLFKHAPAVAEEIKRTYCDAMQTIVSSLFKTYALQLNKFVNTPAGPTSAGQQLANVFSAPLLKMGLPSSAAVVHHDAAAQHEDTWLAISKRGSDPVPISRREEEVGDANDPPIVIHLLPKDGKLLYESSYRSIQKHLMDAATSEYLFLMEFFGAKLSPTLFESIFGKTCAHVLTDLAQFLARNHDLSCQLLMIKISQQHRTMMHDQRKLSCLDAYFDSLEQQLWPSVKRVMDSNIKSLMNADARKLFGVAGPNSQPSFWVRKYALLSGNVSYMAQTLGKHGDGSLPRALEILRKKALELLDRQQRLLPDKKSQLVFTINNCEQVLNVFMEMDSGELADKQAFEEVLSLAKQHYVEEELMECGFNRLIRFLKVKETTQLGGESEAREVGDLVKDFHANWRSGADLIATTVKRNFPTNFKEMLGLCLTQLCLYYQRFRELVRDHPGAKNNMNKLVEMSTLFAEVERYSKTVV